MVADLCPKPLVRELLSEPGAMRRAVSELIAELTRRGHSRPALTQLELVLAEALNNVVEHAYAGHPQGWIRIAIRGSETAFDVEIRDQGREMPVGRLPAAELPDMSGPVTDLPEGGFGCFLVRALTEDLTYQRIAGRNTLRFQMPAVESATGAP